MVGLVRKIVLFLNCGFRLGMFQLSTVKQIVFANISAQKTCSFDVCNKNFQSRTTVSNHKLTYFSYPEFSACF